MKTRPPTPPERPASGDPAAHEIDVAVTGMTCASCVRRVETALSAVPGVAEAAVNLATERARIRFDPALADLAKLRAAVERVGYALETPPATVAASDTTAPEPADRRDAHGLRHR